MFYRCAVLSIILALPLFPQHLIVTAEGHHGAAAPVVSRDNVSVEVDRKQAAITGWVPLRADQSALELYVLIDDGSDTDLGVQISYLKDFIAKETVTTRIGIAYLRNGAATVVAPLTSDHAHASGAVRLPIGQPGMASSPYMGISDVIKKWPAANARREILLISSGIDPWAGSDPLNPYLDKAISDAQRAGVVVHSVYYPEAGHRGHSYWKINWGQNYLSKLSDETGGEAYWQGLTTPVSIAPFLEDLAQRLRNQYLLTISADGAKHDLEPVRVTSATPGVSLVAASKIFLRH